LIQTARKLYAGDSFGLELTHTVYALDSTTIDLCLALFPWARFRKRKGAVKLHTLLDLRGNIPTFIHISDGKLHDVNILDQIAFAARSAGSKKRGVSSQRSAGSAKKRGVSSQRSAGSAKKRKEARGQQRSAGSVLTFQQNVGMLELTPTFALELTPTFACVRTDPYLCLRAAALSFPYTHQSMASPPPKRVSSTGQ